MLCGILLPLCLNMDGLPICFGGKTRLLTPPIGRHDGAPVTSLTGLLHFSSLSAPGFSWSMSDFRVFPCSACSVLLWVPACIPSPSGVASHLPILLMTGLYPAPFPLFPTSPESCTLSDFYSIYPLLAHWAHAF